ncbi:MAG: hypothetical protein IPH48_21225 [bacterium]|nr:hypothetical protein [bacterium]
MRRRKSHVCGTTCAGAIPYDRDQDVHSRSLD